MSGFEVFGKEHIVWLIICAACILILCLADRKNAGREPERGSKEHTSAGGSRLACALGAAVLATHFLESGYRIAEGSYGIDTLPLHICSISVYLVLIHWIRPNRITGELLFCPGIAGALCALIFPDWTMYAPFSFLSVVSFLSHLTIILYVIHAIRTGLIRPSFRHIWIPVVYLAIYAAAVGAFDRHFGVNYGFLNAPSPDSILVPLAEKTGSVAGYYAGYALIVFAGMLVSYGILYLIRAAKSKVLAS